MTENSADRRPAHRPSRRDDILAAGAAEFVDRGFAAVTVSDLARRAGMTPSAVYYHFPTKDDVLLALVQRTGGDLLDLVAVPVEHDDPEEVMRGLVLRFLLWSREHLSEAQLYYVASVGNTSAVEELRRQQQRDLVKAMISGPLRPLRQLLPSTEVTVVALAVLVLFGEVVQMITAQGSGRPKVREAVEAEALRLGPRLVRTA